jgi:hypothetical protein
VIPTRDWDVVAGVAGFKVTAEGFSLLANGYVGKNLGPLLGEQLQFFTTNDVHEAGGWAQLGYDLTQHLNVWVIGGTSRLNQSDVADAGGGRDASSLLGGMVRYQQSGFSFGLEYSFVVAQQIDANGNGAAAGPGALDGTIHAQQFLLSGLYAF